MSDITCLSLSLSLKNSLDQTFRKLKKEENKRSETGFCINRQKIRSYEDKRRIWQHKVRTSDTYVKRIFGIELEFASVYFHGVFQGNVSWFVCTWMQRYIQIWSKTRGKRVKRKKKCKCAYQNALRVVRPRSTYAFRSNIGCITERFRAWHGRKMSGHSLL